MTKKNNLLGSTGFKDPLQWSPEAQAQFEKMPDDAKAAVRDMSAQLRQAFQDTNAGRYASFEDAIEALTGQKPEPLGYKWKHGPYVTVSPHPRRPGKWIAILTDGSYHEGHDVTILTMETLDRKDDARAWMDKMCVEQPWMEDGLLDPAKAAKKLNE